MEYPLFPQKNTPEYCLHRKFEIIPGLLTWITLLGAILISFIAPIFTAILIILYDLFWLIKSIIINGHTIVAYRRMKKAVKINWLKKCRKLEQKHGLKFNDIYHLIIIPYYKEGLEILEPSIKSIAQANFPKKRIIISMSGEKRAGKTACQRQIILKQKYSRYFKEFLTNIHANKKGEMKIKATNANFAAKKALRYLKKNNIPQKHVIVSNFDCDTCIHPQYLAAVAFQFLKSKKRYQQSYQPLPTYNNNIWDTNAIVRIVAIGSSFWHMIESTRPERLITFSSHSMSLKALIEVGLWKKDVISEDSAIFWQCFIHYNGDYRAVPLYIPVSMDATLSKTFLKTLINQYKQKRRWAYGIESFPRIARAFLKNKKIPAKEKIKRVFTILEGHHSWATASFLILFLGWLPLIVGGPQFNETVIAHNLPLVTRTILTIAMIGLVISLFLSLLLLPPKPAKYKKTKYIFLLLQWALVPFVAPLFTLPAIDSQTRLMFKKYFHSFWVSEKTRKDSENTDSLNPDDTAIS
ncbi:MAG: glycosyltransferase family 2 protein [Patescibacteria group bacterium]|nr:glycosyltransferase family 2 protein [Patescibacteria group bacterium]